MGTGMKMKNILKGLRYISQIFDEEEEPEMQIGHPTDVKHVAHIGCDGQSINNSPTWMTEFRSPAAAAGAAAQNKAVPDPHPSDAPPALSSPGRDGGSTRRSRRPQPSGGRADSASRDAGATAEEGVKQGRKKWSSEDAPAAARNPQRRKPKGGGTSSSSSSNASSSTRPKAARSGESRSDEQRPDAVKPAVTNGEAERGEEK